MKNLKNLGKALSRAEQQTINGGKKKLPEEGFCCVTIVTDGGDIQYWCGACESETEA